MAKRNLVVPFLILLHLTGAGQSFIISKPDIELNSNILSIKYGISGCSENERLVISLTVLRSNGDTLKANSVNGDIGQNIICGLNKKIEWDLGKDNVKMDEDIEIYISGAIYDPDRLNAGKSKYKKNLRAEIILSSALLPGLGQKKATHRAAPLALSGLVYGGIGASVIFLLKSNGYKEEYFNADSSTSDEMFNKWKSNFNISRACIFGAIGAYAGNIIWAAAVPINRSSKSNIRLGFVPDNNNFLITASWKF